MNKIMCLNGLLKVSSVVKTDSSEEAFWLEMTLRFPKTGFYWNRECHRLCLVDHHLPQDRIADTRKLIFKNKVFVINHV